MSRVQIPVVAQDAAGNAVSGASVTIVNRQTGQAPTVYTTETGGTARSLPLSTGANGRPPESWVDRAAYLFTVSAAVIGTDTLAWDAAAARDASVDADWLATMPGFGVYRATNYAVNAGGRVLFDQTIYNYDASHDPATGTFTCARAGLYEFSARVAVSTAAMVIQLVIGGVWMDVGRVAAGESDGGGILQASRQMAIGEQAYVRINGPTTVIGGLASTHFNGHMIGR
jgi:hypothetical protein